MHHLPPRTNLQERREIQAMRPLCRTLGAAVTLTLVLPLFAADKKDPPKLATPANTAQDYNALVQAGQVTGKVANLGSSGNSFTLQVEYKVLEPKTTGKGTSGNTLQHEEEVLLKEQERLMKTQNPLQRIAALQHLASHSQHYASYNATHSPFKVATTTHDFEVQAAEDVKVRILQLPDAFDEKGNAKKYTAQELKDLKGSNTSLPGYTSEFANLKNGQTVTVTISKKKPETKDKDAKADDKTPLVSMIVITKDVVDKGGTDTKKKN